MNSILAVSQRVTIGASSCEGAERRIAEVGVLCLEQVYRHMNSSVAGSGGVVTLKLDH